MVNSVQLDVLSASAAAVSSSSKSPETGTDFSAAMLSAETNSLEDIFQRAAETYGVSVDLLKAIAKIESNFNPNAVSYCGAAGVMQLMPQTAAYLGVTDVFDPEQNIMGGAKLISQHLNQYGGDIKLALAAYNAGVGNVAKYGGIPPFKETQTYIAKVIEAMGGELNAAYEVSGTAEVAEQPQTFYTYSRPVTYNRPPENGKWFNSPEMLITYKYMEMMNTMLSEKKEKTKAD